MKQLQLFDSRSYEVPVLVELYRQLDGVQDVVQLERRINSFGKSNPWVEWEMNRIKGHMRPI